jgi:hypothetical protein
VCSSDVATDGLFGDNADISLSNDFRTGSYRTILTENKNHLLTLLKRIVSLHNGNKNHLQKRKCVQFAGGIHDQS